MELVAAVYGYGAGSAGVVSGITASGRLLVRFSDTGHSIFVVPSDLRLAGDR